MVEPTSTHTTVIDPDAAIAGALRAFVCALGPAASDVEMTYRAGVVTLSGAVASTIHLQAVEDLLAAHDGVERVVSELRVTAPGVQAGRN